MSPAFDIDCNALSALHAAVICRVSDADRSGKIKVEHKSVSADGRNGMDLLIRVAFEGIEVGDILDVCLRRTFSMRLSGSGCGNFLS